MRTLTSETARGAYLRSLSVGEKLKVMIEASVLRSRDAEVTTYDLASGPFEAEVIEADAEQGRSEVQVTVPGIVGGWITTLYHSDGESLNERDERENGYVGGVYINVAEEQEDEVEVLTGTVEGGARTREPPCPRPHRSATRRELAPGAGAGDGQRGREVQAVHPAASVADRRGLGAALGGRACARRRAREGSRLMARYIADRKTTLAAVVPSLHHGLLVVTVAEEGIWYREKGRRTSFLLPHGVAFQRAVDLHVQRERAERKSSRKKRRR